MPKGEKIIKKIFLTIKMAIALSLLILAVVVTIFFFTREPKIIIDSEAQISEENLKKIAFAKNRAATYDYDTAISTLKEIDGYEESAEILTLISEIEDTKASCVPVKAEDVTHIFYHSLVVDPVRAFSNPETRKAAIGHNQWMTTIDEFNKITQEMYDRGYVLVSVHDLVKEISHKDGSVTYEMGEVLLPPGKKPFILSLDDLNYYHSYDGFGYATKIVLDESGKPMCEYIDAEGNTSVGAYDAVPLMDAFIEEHPDACYHDARGIIALTGYNGILGYRSDISYNPDNSNMDRNKKQYLLNHPEFDLNYERQEAKKVADAMKAEGWEFASHTWGHLRAGEISMSLLQTDTQKWMENVAPLVGDTDMIIFAYGADIGSTPEYNQDNERFQYLKSQGFNMFFNVDSKVHTFNIYESYIHNGRRNLDGYRMYYNILGQQNNLSDLFDPKEVFDPARPPVESLLQAN